MNPVKQRALSRHCKVLSCICSLDSGGVRWYWKRWWFTKHSLLITFQSSFGWSTNMGGGVGGGSGDDDGCRIGVVGEGDGCEGEGGEGGSGEGGNG